MRKSPDAPAGPPGPGKRILKIAGAILGAIVVLGLIAFELLDLLLPSAPAPPPAPVRPGEPGSEAMATSEWLWMGGIALAAMVSLLLVRRWVFRRPIGFEVDGKLYRHHPDGHFTDGMGARIVDPARVAALTEAADAARRERSREGR